MTDKEELNEALKHLSSVLDSEELIAIPEGTSSLFQACEIIGNASKISFVCPANPPISLETICVASKTRYRRVVLTPDWWENKQGPLLGFLNTEGDRTPVALVIQRKRYVIINPQTRQTLTLDRSSSALLQPFAYMFYKPLPEEIKGIKEIAKYCLQDTLKDYFYLSLSGALVVLLGFLFPLANKVFFDYVIPHLNMHLYVQMLLAILVGTISSVIFLFCRSFFVLKLSGTLEHRLQMGLWDRLFQLPVHFFRTLGLGDLINRTLVVEQFRRNLSENTLLILFNAIFSIIYLIIMLFYSWQLSLIGLAVCLIALTISIVLSLIKLSYDRALLASYAHINTFLTQVVNGIAKIRVAYAENRIFSHWTKSYRENQALTLKSSHYQMAIGISNNFFSTFATFLMYAFIIWWMYSQTTQLIFKVTPVITVGTFLAFTAAFAPFLTAVLDIGNNFSSLLSFVPFWQRARPLFVTPIEDEQSKATPEGLTGSCKIENVSFRYHANTPLILEGISMEIPAQGFIGIVGPSGSGKSTLLQLLIGFETPSQGTISYDHLDMQHLNLRALRAQMGIVTPNSGIFFGTIFDNIACGRHYETEELWQALELSMLAEELSELPMGLYTILPGGGTTLSGGQRQKLLLARALVRKPKILLLDEATSSLDNQTQHQISENLKGLGMTRIVVAHRFSTIIKADQIYVMEKGRLTASGSFDTLLSQNAWFKRCYERQERPTEKEQAKRR